MTLKSEPLAGGAVDRPVLPHAVREAGQSRLLLRGQVGWAQCVTPCSPCELDAYVFGQLYTLLTTELPGVDVGYVVKKYDNLRAFAKRVESAYFTRDKKK